MDILVVNETLHRATQLYYRFVRQYEIPVSMLQKHRREVRYGEYTICFVSKAQLDIYLRGRRNAKLIHGPDLEARLS